MSSICFRERLQTGKVPVSDGVTGANLQKHGLPTDTFSDIRVMDNPAGVKQLHRDFLAAGVQLVAGCCATLLEHLQAIASGR